MNQQTALLDYFESKRSFWIAAVFILAMAILAVTSMRNPVDYDGFWHLRMGMDWVRNGLSPWVDHYSFTFLGETIRNPPVLFQVVLYGFVALFGDYWGMVLCKYLACTLIIGLTILWLRVLRSPVLVYLLVLPLLVVALQFRAQVRPEIFSYSLVIIAFILYERNRLQLSFSAMAPVVALLLFWTIYHSSILGYVIFFGLFVDIAVRLLKERAEFRDWLVWFGWGLATVAVGFANPQLSHVVIETLLFPNDWKLLIQEYKTPGAELNMAAGYLLLAIALASTLGSLLQKRLGYLIILIVFFYASAKMLRMVAPTALVCVLVLAAVLTSAFQEMRSRGTLPAGRQALPWISLLASAVTLYLGFHYALGFLKENRGSWTNFPAALVDHYIETGKSGNIFNDYEMGGYLIYRLSPDSKVQIDGRTGILYPVDHYLRHIKARMQPELFIEQVEQYDIQHAVLIAGSDSASLMDAVGFELDYLGVRYALFTRSGGALAEFGKLWTHPQCWDRLDQDLLANELAPFMAQSQQSSPTHSTLKLVTGFVHVDEKLAFLDFMARNAQLDDAGYRIIAFRAFDLGQPELSLHALSRIKNRIPTDDLAVIESYLGMNELQMASSALENALAYPWKVVLPAEELLQARWVEKLHQLNGLGPIASARLAQSRETPGSGSDLPLEPVSMNELCIQLD